MNKCNFFWGSHGCDGVKDHGFGRHICMSFARNPNDEDNNFEIACCEYDEIAPPEKRVRFNYSDDPEMPEWGEWVAYGEGWYQ